MPERRQTTQAPESLAATYSMPVPTMGASVRMRGTAWRCMLAPMRARLASSFSRKGMSEAATETTCLGLTSMSVTLSRATILVSPATRTVTSSSRMAPSASTGTLACAMTCSSSSQAER